MPTVLKIGPYLFRFYSLDKGEPPHIHVKRDRSEAKFWLELPVRLEWQRGYAAHELNDLRRLVEENREYLLEQWHGHFN